MNKKLNIIVFFFVMILLSSCYEDYITDYDNDAVYFTYQTDVRSFVVGEGMSIKVGVALGGVRDNKRDRTVTYTIDNGLLTEDVLAAMKNGVDYVKQSVANVTALSSLPSGYYSLSDNNKMIIKAGNHSGTVTIKADSLSFLTDAATLSAGYALALRITNAAADTVPESKNYTVIGLKYENMLFGNYWHGGQIVVTDAEGKQIKTENYFTTIPQPESMVLGLKTSGPHTLVTNKIGNGSGSFMLTLNPDGSISVDKAPGSSVEVSSDGECRFNKAKLLQDRKLFLKYKYRNTDGTVSHATDTLTFRNRIRDGVNEWQDENPSNYE
jgi:hypothetical protein